jgi:hypothetical protein
MALMHLPIECREDQCRPVADVCADIKEDEALVRSKRYCFVNQIRFAITMRVVTESSRRQDEVLGDWNHSRRYVRLANGTTSCTKCCFGQDSHALRLVGTLRIRCRATQTSTIHSGAIERWILVAGALARLPVSGRLADALTDPLRDTFAVTVNNAAGAFDLYVTGNCLTGPGQGCFAGPEGDHRAWLTFWLRGDDRVVGQRPVEWCISVRSSTSVSMLGGLEFEREVLLEVEDGRAVHGEVAAV